MNCNEEVSLQNAFESVLNQYLGQRPAAGLIVAGLG
jgi:hypothetical protein